MSFLEPLLVVCRLGLVVSVIGLSVLSAVVNKLTAALLVLLFCIELSKFIGNDDPNGMDYIGRTYGFFAEVMVLCKVMLQLAFILIKSGDTQYIVYWLIPLALSYALAAFSHLARSGPTDNEIDRKNYDRVSESSRPIGTYYNKKGIFILFAFLTAVTIAEAMTLRSSLSVDDSTDGLLILILFGFWFVSVCMCWMLYKYEDADQRNDLWMGGSAIPLQWAFISLVPTPLLSSAHLSMRVLSVTIVLLICQLSLMRKGVEQPSMIRRLIDIPKSILMILKSSLSFIGVAAQLSACVGIALVATTLNDDYFVTSLKFSGFAKDFASLYFKVLEGYVRPLHEIMANEKFRLGTKIIIGELTLLKHMNIRAMQPEWKTMNILENGKDYPVRPTENLLSMIIFIMGPVTLVAGILCQLFKKGNEWVQSKYFWVYQAVIAAAWLALINFISDIAVTSFKLITGGPTYSRTYTYEGKLGLIGWALIFGSSLIMACYLVFVATLEKVALMRQSGLIATSGAASRLLSGPKFIFAEIKRVLLWPIRTLTKGSNLLLIFSAFLFIVAVGYGSPITVSTPKRIDDGTPKYLRYDSYDAQGILIKKLSGMLGFKARFIPYVETAAELGVQELKCKTCFCMISFNAIGGAIKDFTVDAANQVNDQANKLVSGVCSIFGCRRLLQAPFSPADPLTFQPAGSKRKLMTAQEAGCSPLSCPSGLSTFCIMDFIKDVTGVVVSMLNAIADLVDGVAFDLIVKIVPFARIVEELIDQASGIFQFLDFKLIPAYSFKIDLSFLNLGFDLFGFDVNFDYSVFIPSFTTGTVVLLIVILVVSWITGIFEAMFELYFTIFEIVVISGILGSLLVVVVGWESVKYILTQFDWEMHEIWLLPAWVWAAALFVLLMSVMQSASEAGLEKVERAMSKLKK